MEIYSYTIILKRNSLLIEELRRHIRAILDERRRMVWEGYNYEDNEVYFIYCDI
jgi:hypothetical protein